LSIVIWVAFETDHFNVDDCPRSIEDGSAENSVISGAAGGGGAGAGAAGGGGGGGGGAFFLQPEASATSKIAIQMTLNFRFINTIFAS
jgi:hypothetical protein